MTLDKLLEHGKEAAEHLFEKQGNVLPMWIAEDEAGTIAPIIMPLLEDKNKSATIIKQTLQEIGAVRYVSILEAWIYEPRKDEVDERYLSGEIPVREHPDRREVIMIVAEDKRESISGLFYILRPEHGEAKLSPFKELGRDTQSSGRFHGLLS